MAAPPRYKTRSPHEPAAGARLYSRSYVRVGARGQLNQPHALRPLCARGFVNAGARFMRRGSPALLSFWILTTRLSDNAGALFASLGVSAGSAQRCSPGADKAAEKPGAAARQKSPRTRGLGAAELPAVTGEPEARAR